MRLCILLTACLLLFGCAARPTVPAAVDPLQLPQIGGTLVADLVLAGDYLLTADLQVPTGITLTIKAGSRIFVQPSDSTKIDPEFLSRETEILIRGNLYVDGSSAEPVIFKPVTDDPQAILWSGLQLVEAGGVQLQHLIVEQAEAGVLCINASPVITGLQVRRSRYGMLLQQQSAPQVYDSVFSTGEAGLFCWDQSAPRLQNSRIIDQQEEGIYLGRGCRGVFVGNQVANTDRGVILPAGVSFAASNRVIDNRLDFVRYPQEAE